MADVTYLFLVITGGEEYQLADADGPINSQHQGQDGYLLPVVGGGEYEIADLDGVINNQPYDRTDVFYVISDPEYSPQFLSSEAGKGQPCDRTGYLIIPSTHQEYISRIESANTDPYIVSYELLTISYLFSGKILIVGADDTNYLDGKIVIYSFVETNLDGKIVIYSLAQVSIDGRVQFVNSPLVNNNFDGKIFIFYYSESETSLDGRVHIYIASGTPANAFFDGKVTITQSVNMYQFDLPELADGRHKLRVVIKNIADASFEDEEYFVVDTVGPTITVTSPVNGSSLTDYPQLNYNVSDATTGIREVKVIITDVSTNVSTNYGWLKSGTYLDFLDDGVYKIKIKAEDLAYGSSGNITEEEITITLTKDVDFLKVPEWLYIGADSSESNQADGIIEELRILNEASDEADLINDFKILNAGIRFQNRSGSAVLTSAEIQALVALGADSSRVNLPGQTLALFHFDSNLNSEAGVGDLEQELEYLVSEKSSTNDIHIIVRYRESDNIDKDLIEDLLNKIKLAHTELVVDFELVTD